MEEVESPDKSEHTVTLAAITFFCIHTGQGGGLHSRVLFGHHPFFPEPREIVYSMYNNTVGYTSC